MSATIEIVRFDVPPERHAELLAGHDDARRAIAAVSPPGALWSRLARIGTRGWIEIVAWAQRATFDRALELSPGDPVAGPWFELADPGYTIMLGEAASGSAGPPPRQGELELTWGPGELGLHPPDDASPPGAWSSLIEVESRAWVDPSGWADGEPSTLRLIAAGGPAPAGGTATPGAGRAREVARIAHAVDSAGERGGAG
jgi:hypothetical protein